jgi:hypothetical protein
VLNLEKQEKSVDLEGRLSKAFNNEAVPKFYFNGFAAQVTSSDVQFVLECNNKPIACLNASFSVAKTFVRHLGYIMQTLEEKTGNTIMTQEDIVKSLGNSKEVKIVGKE